MLRGEGNGVGGLFLLAVESRRGGEGSLLLLDALLWVDIHGLIGLLFHLYQLVLEAVEHGFGTELGIYLGFEVLAEIFIEQPRTKITG